MNENTRRDNGILKNELYEITINLDETFTIESADNILTVLQGNTIVQIDIFNGTLLAHNKFASHGCYLGIFKIEEGYLIHGEIEIIMFDFHLNKKWTFEGEDVFVSASNKKSFDLGVQSIKLYDFQDNFYEIDFNGQLLK